MMNTQIPKSAALYVLMPAGPQEAQLPTQAARGPADDMDAVALYSAPWVRLSRWCALTDDTSDAVHARRKAGKWVDGKHCRVADDGKLWVNLREASAWVAGKAA